MTQHPTTNLYEFHPTEIFHWFAHSQIKHCAAADLLPVAIVIRLE
jgi:hypothetical protein